MPMQLRSRKIGDDVDGGEAAVNLLDQGDNGGNERSSTPSVAEDDDLDFVVVKNSKDKMLERQRSIKGDEGNIALLLFLYVLQGIPLGLAAAVPLILTNRHVSYRQQAEFSFAYWPFSIKLLWAPIVDSCFVASFGRRKTWLVPVQYLLGATMFLLSRNVDYYLGDDPNGPKDPDVFSLTCMFFFLNFLAATQDIAVDGWALTMLQPHNVGYASTCNSVGQTAGYFLGYVFYIGLESYGVVTLADFLLFWSVIFVIATTLVAVFKHESEAMVHPAHHEDGAVEELELGVGETYAMLWKIMTLPLMPAFIALLLTQKIGFSAADSVTSLKLIEQGVPKDKLAMLAIPMIPVQILLPVLVSRYTTGPRPMDIYLTAFVPRLLFGLVYAWLVWITPSFALEDGSFPPLYYGLIIGLFLLHQVTTNCMFVASMALYARVSDPAVGGTYMTLLNTLSNLGGNWPTTVALWFVDSITVKECAGLTAAAAKNVTTGNVCDGSAQQSECESAGGHCHTLRDGYYIESGLCVAFGVLWLLIWGRRTVMKLQTAELSEWRVVSKAKKKRAKERLA